MAEKKSNKPTFTFIKTKRPAPKGELQKMAKEYEEDAKEKKANKGKQTPSEAKAMLEKKKKMKAGGALKAPTGPGLKKLPTEVRNKMGYMKAGGKVGYSKGGIVDRQYLKGR